MYWTAAYHPSWFVIFIIPPSSCRYTAWWQQKLQHVCLRRQSELFACSCLSGALQDLLEARSVRVLVVSFGCVEGAQLWLKQTGCTFEMLLDPQRKVCLCFHPHPRTFTSISLSLEIIHLCFIFSAEKQRVSSHLQLARICGDDDDDDVSEKLHTL